MLLEWCGNSVPRVRVERQCSDARLPLCRARNAPERDRVLYISVAGEAGYVGLH